MPTAVTEAMIWQPDSGPEIAGLRASMLDRIRCFFHRSQVLEVDTPALSHSAVSDPHIESVSAALNLDKRHPYYLHTSPEYCMKRLLCGGYPDIYQICKVFRDNEAGRSHQPEFTMIEWYRLGFDLDQIITNTLGLIANLLDEVDLRTTVQRLSYRDAFLQFAKCDPFTVSITALCGLLDADDALKESIGDDKDSWLDLILDKLVTPRFEPDQLTVLHHYPISQAALARRCPSNSLTADRFEVFLGKHELANGYVEITDPDELESRFDSDQAVRGSRGQIQRPLDDAFLAAMRNGLPECAGVAVGLDRLLMIRAGASDIRNVQTFAFLEHAQS